MAVTSLTNVSGPNSAALNHSPHLQQELFSIEDQSPHFAGATLSREDWAQAFNKGFGGLQRGD